MQNILDSQRSVAIKKAIFDLMGAKNYSEFEEILNRITYFIATDKDGYDFIKFLNKVFESGYYKAAYEYKEQLKKFDINVEIKT